MLPMTTALDVRLDDWFARDLDGLYEPWRAAPTPAPRALVVNDALAAELGLDPAALRSPAGIALLVGAALPDGARPIAQAYAGHQFGGFSPRLGDGRALLLGELVDPHGRRHDLHLKGSGRTPFARGGDGKAAVGPMLREYVISEAMHALGIPTTRALAVVATGEQIAREEWLPGAVLARTAASHLRVGSFQYAAAHADPTLLRRLADHAIARHHPAAAEDAEPYLALYRHVVEVQAALVARWMHVGFVHGVMNTDNMTISGETIDYGPCAFMDTFDPATVFSSIDHGGRYAWGNQPDIAQWNLARLGEAMLRLFSNDRASAAAAATEVLHTYPARFDVAWRRGMWAKLGLATADDTTPPAEPAELAGLVDDCLLSLHTHRVDYTGFFRALADHDRGAPAALQALFPGPLARQTLLDWLSRRASIIGRTDRSPDHVADAMDAVNPAYIPRNHLVEEALAAAVADDLAPFEALVEVVRRPFDRRPDLDRYAAPAPTGAGRYVTYCGT